MIVIPRRPFSAEFLEFERTAFDLAWTLYGYRWAEGSEVPFSLNILKLFFSMLIR